MGLIYRTVFQVEEDDLSSLARDFFATWVAEKYDGAELPESGETGVADGVRVRVNRADGEPGVIAQFALYEERETERWTTKLTTTEPSGTGTNSVWVDLERVAEDPYARFEVAAPRVVRNLIEQATNPHRGPIKLTIEPRAYRPDEIGELVSLLESPDRDIPVVILTKASHVDGDTWVERAVRAGRGLAGTTVVILLPPNAEPVFNERVGRDHGVWNGALRVYLPGFDPSANQPWRHRYVPAYQLDRYPETTRRRVGRLVSPYITNMRAPREYASLRPLLRATRAGDAADLEELLDEADREIHDLERQVQLLEERNFTLAAELEDTEQQNSRLRRSFALHATSDEDSLAKLAELPVNAPDCVGAVDLARANLTHVVITDDACIDLDILDSATEAGAWADKIWHGLQALDAYAQDDDVAGGFWEWCENSSHPMTWPATYKKLAMRESESTMGSKRFRKARTFTIDQRVESSGRIIMEAHMKIAEGGGENAPRIYFHDDTKGATGKVHVGFIGPHKHVPNDSA